MIDEAKPKDGAKPPSARRLTPDQIEWHARWPVHVVTAAEDVPGLLAGRVVEAVEAA